MSTSPKVQKRKNAHKYSELQDDDIQEEDVRKVLGKGKQAKTHAFDGISAD